jgi:hypothetical protein
MIKSTRILIGPHYHHFNIEMYDKMIEPIVERPLPAKLAWTKMNTSWKKGKRR